jgi:type II secretory pathway pseudopilin PulG
MVNKMLMRKPAANKMIGLTMLETMFALAVGAFVLIAAIILYKSITLNSNVSQVMNDMNTIRAGYKNYLISGYTFNADSDALQLQAVQNAGFLPSTLNDPWGLPYFVSLTNSHYPGYIIIGIPGLDLSSKDPRCMAIWKAAQTTGALSTNYTWVGYNCAFLYRFP